MFLNSTLHDKIAKIVIPNPIDLNHVKLDYKNNYQ